MAVKNPENQRIREIVAYFGYSDNIHGFATDLLKWERSDKIRNITEDKTRVTTEILVEFTKKLVSRNGEKLDGHWLLTGEGQMFLQENSTAATNSDETAIKRERDELLKDLAAFRELARQNAQAILNLSGGRGPEATQEAL